MLPPHLFLVAIASVLSSQTASFMKKLLHAALRKNVKEENKEERLTVSLAAAKKICLCPSSGGLITATRYFCI